MSQQILIIVGDGGESYETWFAVHRFQEAGYVTRVAAPTKRRLNLVIHDFEPGWDTYLERPGYFMDADLSFDDVVVKDYVGVLLIGGRAPEYLRNDKRVLDVVPGIRSAREVGVGHLSRRAAHGGRRGHQEPPGDLLRARADGCRGRRSHVARSGRGARRPVCECAHLATASRLLPRGVQLPERQGRRLT